MKSSVSTPHHSRSGRALRGTGIALAVVVAVLIVARLALPFAVEWGVNRSLAKNDQVTGHIGDVGISLWRGAYQVKDIALKDATKKNEGDFLTAKVVDFSIDMKELIRHRRILAQSKVYEPMVNLALLPKPDEKDVHGAKEKAKESGKEVKNAVLPVDVSRIEVTSGTIFMPALIKGGEPVKADRVWLVGENLYKTGTTKGNTVDNTASLSGSAHMPGNGMLNLDLRFDPAAEPASFSVKVKLEGLDLAALNPVLQPETGIDLRQGKGYVYAEIESKDGKFEGYVKPILQDVEVADGHKGESLGTRVKKKTVQIVKNLVKNDKKDSVATRIPLKGTLDDPKASVWASIRMTLRHAWIHAIRPGLEGEPSPEPPKAA